MDPHYEFRAKVVVERRDRLGGNGCIRDGWIAPGKFKSSCLRDSFRGPWW